MATVYPNLIPLETIKKIKNYYLDKSFESRGNHPDFTDRLQWENCLIDSNILGMIDPYLKKIVGDYEISSGCGVFQRCYIPFGMHIDSKYRIDPGRTEVEGEENGKAILIPLDESPHCNTVFWKEYFKTDAEKMAAFYKFIDLPEDQVQNNHVGDEVDLDFCWQDVNRKLFNHYKLDVIFKWRLCDVAVWDRTQLHAASDFTKHHPFKDAITIFIE